MLFFIYRCDILHVFRERLLNSDYIFFIGVVSYFHQYDADAVDFKTM